MKTTPFWFLDQRRNIFEIDERLLVHFLSEYGFATYFLDSEMTAEPQFLYKKGNIIEPISPLWIHKMVIAAIESGIIDKDILPENVKNDLVSKLIESKILAKKEVLVILSGLDKQIISDTKDSAYFFFKNTGVKVSKEGIELFPLETLDNYVWESQIIDRDFVSRDYEEIEKNSDYFYFDRLKNALKMFEIQRFSLFSRHRKTNLSFRKMFNTT